MAKDSFILYLEQKQIFEMLTDEEAGQLIKAIFEYEDTGQTVTLDRSLQIAFLPIKNVLDRNKEKYEKVVERNKKNIEKRWNKEDTKNTTGKNGIPKNTKNTDNDNEHDNDNDNEHDNDNDNEHDNDKKEKNKKRKTFDDVFSENHFSNDLENTIKDFIDMRKTIKKPMTTKALELLIRNLKKLTNLEDEQIAILNQSIEHGWQTVYPLKQFKNNSSNGNINDFKDLMEEAQNEQAGNYTSNNTFGW
jgi:hypothetical protein